MFVTPMISVYPSDFDRKQKQYSLNRSSTSSTSSGSSEASSLHRTSSTNSNASNSRWSTSSISSVETNTVATKHRKRSSRVSFNLPRPLQPFHKKVQSQPHILLPQTPRSHPPPRPARPEEIIQSLVQPKCSVDIQRQPEVQPKAEAKRLTQKLRKRSDSAPIASAATHSTKDSPEWPSFILPAPPPPPPPSVTPLTPPLTPSSPGAQWQCSDLVVRCKSDVYHVDRTIMCYHSKWFARVCAIMTSPKASKSVIDLSADDSDAVAAMMQYCYQLDYTNKSFSTDCGIDEVADLRPHVAVFMLAERYGMAGLKRTALEKFENLATTVLKISGDEEQFLQAVSAMYAPTRRANADELRHVAVQICADHVQGFISGNHATMAMVFESMDSLPEFRSDLFDEMARRWK